MRKPVSDRNHVCGLMQTCLKALLVNGEDVAKDTYNAHLFSDRFLIIIFKCHIVL